MAIGLCMSHEANAQYIPSFPSLGAIAGQSNQQMEEVWLPGTNGLVDIRQMRAYAAPSLASETEGQQVQVTIDVQGDSINNIEPLMVYFFNGDNQTWEFVDASGAKAHGTAVAKLAADTYDIIVLFDSKHISVKENVDLTTNKTVDFNISDQTKTIKFRDLAPDGTPWQVPFYTRGGETIDAGNCAMIRSIKQVAWEGRAFTGMVGNVWEAFDTRYDPSSYDIHITPVSDKFSFTNKTIYYCTTDGKIYFTSRKLAGTAVDSITSYASNAKPYDEKIAFTPTGNDVYVGGYKSYSSFGTAGKNEFSVTTLEAKLDPSTVNVGLMLDVEEDKDPVKASNLLVAVAKGNGVQKSDGYYVYPTVGAFMTRANGEQRYAFLANADDAFLNANFDGDATLPSYPLPEGHPLLTYTEKEKVGEFGECTPIFMARLKTSTSSSGKRTIVEFAPTWMGPKGEEMLYGQHSSTVSVAVNDQPIDSIVTIEALKQNLSKIAASSATDQKLTIKFTSSFPQANGLEHTNTATMAFNYRNQDWTPPTIRAFQVRNSAGRVTSNIALNSEATAIITAADISYKSAKYLVGNVEKLEMQIAVNGSTNAWQDVEVEKLTDYSYRNYGQTFKADLGEAIKGRDAGSYDVKLVCTDATGNTTEQVLTNALTITNPSAVTDLRADGDAIADAYDIQGRLVARQVTRGNFQPGTRGIYILKYNNGSSEKVIR